MWIPPIGVRRVFIDPLVDFFALLSVLVSPILFAIAIVLDVFGKGRHRTRPPNGYQGRALQRSDQAQIWRPLECRDQHRVRLPGDPRLSR